MSTWRMRFATGVLAAAWWQAAWPTSAVRATVEDALQQSINGETVSPRRILGPDWPMIQSVSADGRFGVGRQRAGNSTLRVVLRDMSTGATRVLFTGGGASTISDDGRIVAFTTTYGDSLGLVSTDPGAAPRFFPSPEGKIVRTEDWAPSGDRVLVYLSRGGEGGQPAVTELAWFSPADRMFRTIRTFLSSEQPGVPRVAPNGRYVTFTVAEPGNTNGRLIFVMDSDGGATERVAVTEGELPNWTPDSRHLMFVRARDGKSELWSIGVAGGRRATEPRLLYGDLAGRLLGMTSAGALIFRRGDSPNDDNNLPSGRSTDRKRH